MLFSSALTRASLPEIETVSSLEERIARGDADAVVEAYRAHHGHVRGFAQRLVGDRMVAEDLVHEVFVALPDSMRRFEGQCSLRTWLVAPQRSRQVLPNGTGDTYHQHLLQPRVRALFGWRFAEHFGIFGGPSLLLQARMIRDGNETLFRVGPEFVVGVEL